MTARNSVTSVAALMLSMLLLVACDSGSKTTTKSMDDSSDALATRVKFTDLTESAGLAHFKHVNGATGKKWFPEAMGSGVAFADIDGDGWQDILAVGGGRWPGDAGPGTPALQIYRNQHDGTFADWTQRCGLDKIEAYGFGVAIADIDNDGDQDIYFTTIAENMLFINENGKFRETAASAGVAGGKTWSSSAIFFDANLDGKLDLYVGNYVNWSPENDLFCTLDGETKSYCTPELYKGVASRFYYGNGDGTFRDASEQAGFLPAPGKTLGVVACDFNDDEWPDLIVANDTQRDLLYQNKGDGTFDEIGMLSGIAYDENGRARAGMGIDAGYVDDSGKLTVFVGNFSKEMIGVYRYIDNGLFNDRAAASRIGRPSLMTLTFGLFLFDADHDGLLDLYAANGHVQEEIEKTQDGIFYREPSHLFINKGNGRFVDAAPEAGGVLQEKLVARGAAYADIDHDGDLDVLVSENHGALHLWRNDSPSSHNWLQISCRGKNINRDAIGALVTIYQNGKAQKRRVRTGGSFLSQSTFSLHFGLGAANQADSVRVQWRPGSAQVFANVAANNSYVAVEGKNTLGLNTSVSNGQSID